MKQEIGGNKQTSKATACTNPLLSRPSSEGAGWGRGGSGSLCVCLRIIFRAGCQQCQHENNPVAARKFSHDTSKANSGGTKRILWQQQDSFLHFVPTVGFKHGLKQVERNFHPAVSDGATFCRLSHAGKSCVSINEIKSTVCSVISMSVVVLLSKMFQTIFSGHLKRHQMYQHMWT